jgi:predicted Zn-dependent peptidase
VNDITLEYTDAGIPVVTENIKGTISSGFLVAVGTGSRDESKDIMGISHLLEHVVFRGTKSRTSLQISKEMEGAGR